MAAKLSSFSVMVSMADICWQESERGCGAPLHPSLDAPGPTPHLGILVD